MVPREGSQVAAHVQASANPFHHEVYEICDLSKLCDEIVFDG